MKNLSKKTFSLLLSLVLSAVLAAGGITASAEKYDSNTDFIAGKYGVFLHYLLERQGGGQSLDGWNQAVNSFDVNGFAADMHDVGASWVTITLTQSSGYFPIPMPEMETLTGVKCGTQRDLVKDLIDALDPYGIKVMLYWHPGLPDNNTALAKALGAEFKQNQGDATIGQASSGNWMLSYTACKNVAGIAAALSERYGEKVVGWWFDGCYDNVGFNDRLARLYGDAVRSGNPNTLVCFNNGTKFHDCRFEAENYSAGETGHPNSLETTAFTSYSVEDRWSDNGYQEHRLTFLGENWGLGGTIYDTETLAKHSYEAFLKNGAALSFDVAISADGKVNSEHLAQLRAIRDYVRSQPEIVIEPAPQQAGTNQIDASAPNGAGTDTDIAQTVEKKTVTVNRNVPLAIALGAECVVIVGAAVFLIVKKKSRKTSV